MENLLTALIKATGWSILHSLWQGALVYLVLLLLFIARPGLTSRTKHNLSVMALLAMLVWFVLTFCSLLNESFNTSGASNGLTISASSAYRPYANDLAYSLLGQVEQHMPFIVSVYGIGLMVQIFVLSAGFRRIYMIKRGGLMDVPEHIHGHFKALCQKLEIKRNVVFALSSHVDVPLVIGYVKPVVLLPLSLLTRFTPQQLETIIIHELAHIRRNDYLLNMLKVGIETILFFNPFVWLTGKMIETQREHACDDLVIQLTGRPIEYAFTLLQLEKARLCTPQLSIPITGKSQSLLHRIKRITDAKLDNAHLKFQLLILVVGIFGMLSLGWSAIKNEFVTVDTIKTAKRATARSYRSGLEASPLTKESTWTTHNLRNANVRSVKAAPFVQHVHPQETRKPKNKPTESSTPTTRDSKLSMAKVQKLPVSSIPADSAGSIIWLDKNGKIISAEPKIVYYSKTLSGYTIDPEGNILDGKRKWLDKLDGGKPIVKIDSTGEMSRTLSRAKVADFIKGGVATSTAQTLTSAGNFKQLERNDEPSARSITSNRATVDVIEQLKEISPHSARTIP